MSIRFQTPTISFHVPTHAEVLVEQFAYLADHAEGQCNIPSCPSCRRWWPVEQALMAPFLKREERPPHQFSRAA